MGIILKNNQKFNHINYTEWDNYRYLILSGCVEYINDVYKTNYMLDIDVFVIDTFLKQFYEIECHTDNYKYLINALQKIINLFQKYFELLSVFELKELFLTLTTYDEQIIDLNLYCNFNEKYEKIQKYLPLLNSLIL